MPFILLIPNTKIGINASDDIFVTQDIGLCKAPTQDLLEAPCMGVSQKFYLGAFKVPSLGTLLSSFLWGFMKDLTCELHRAPT